MRFFSKKVKSIFRKYQFITSVLLKIHSIHVFKVTCQFSKLRTRLTTPQIYRMNLNICQLVTIVGLKEAPTDSATTKKKGENTAKFTPWVEI